MSDSHYKLADEAYRDIYAASVDDTELRDVVLKVANAVCQIALTLDAMIELKAKSQCEPQDDKPTPYAVARVLELAADFASQWRERSEKLAKEELYLAARDCLIKADVIDAFAAILHKEFNLG